MIIYNSFNNVVFDQVSEHTAGLNEKKYCTYAAILLLSNFTLHAIKHNSVFICSKGHQNIVIFWLLGNM